MLYTRCKLFSSWLSTCDNMCTVPGCHVETPGVTAEVVLAVMDGNKAYSRLAGRDLQHRQIQVLNPPTQILYPEHQHCYGQERLQEKLYHSTKKSELRKEKKIKGW